MSEQDKSDELGLIANALHAKRQTVSNTAVDIAQLEADLLADIAAFDLEGAERRARAEETRPAPSAALANGLVFPQIVPEGLSKRSPTTAAATSKASDAAVAAPAGGLLAELRDRAAQFQREQHFEEAQRTAVNEVIDNGLRQVFAYLHDMVAQLNVVKPRIPRTYRLLDELQLSDLAWQEGFADYRVQSQSAGALFEIVTLSYQLKAPRGLSVEREGAAIERFRTLLFDYGLQFSCKEFRNERRYVERAEFEVPGQFAVNVRWRADFTQGRVILETRNFERLGSASYSIPPAVMGEGLFDQFGRLLLGEPNTFRETVRQAHRTA